MREAPAEGYNYIFGLRSSNTSTADAADFAIKKTSAREVVFMVPVSRLELPTHALRMRCSTPELQWHREKRTSK